MGSASRPLPVGYLPAVPGNSAALPGPAPITPMSTAASISDNGSRHPRSDRAPSTRAGAAKFVVRRPSVPLFHLPSSIAGAARPMGVHCIVTPHAVQIGHQLAGSIWRFPWASSPNCIALPRGLLQAWRVEHQQMHSALLHFIDFCAFLNRKK
ncbi:uncharacterized protein [Triticum aestivum]|uniref:uncharacterized protein isoform X1 n=1 Tax=Triticum aestivum TaxID=4565 RepID=UPI001D006294|nr:uncharacterized protein LOC123134321 isoform X1 [Triticum aestivum]